MSEKIVRGLGNAFEGQDSLKEELGLDESKEDRSTRFLKAVNNIVRKEIKRDTRGRLAFRPSQVGKCRRQVYYFLQNRKGRRSIDVRVQRIFGIGDALHSWIQDRVLSNTSPDIGIKLLRGEDLPFYGEEGVEVGVINKYGASDIEVKFLDSRWTDVFPISAMVDGAMEFEGIQTLFEFKSINSRGFRTLEEPLPAHIMQGSMYALCTGVRNVMFLYLCKDTQEMKAYEIVYTDRQIEWTLNYIQEIEKDVVSSKLPDKEQDKGDCTYCGYRTICEKE